MGSENKSTHFLVRKSQLLSERLPDHSLAAKFQYFFLMLLNTAVSYLGIEKASCCRLIQPQEVFFIVCFY